MLGHLERADITPPHPERCDRIEFFEGGNERLVGPNQFLGFGPVFSPNDQSLCVLAHRVEGGFPNTGLDADKVVGLNIREELRWQFVLCPRQITQCGRAPHLVGDVGQGGWYRGAAAQECRGSDCATDQSSERSTNSIASVGGGAVVAVDGR